MTFSDNPLPLEMLQVWMHREIIGSQPENSFGQVEEFLLPSRRLTADQRLQIYSRAYFARLLECLGEEFTTLRSVVGEEGFAELMMGYLGHTPPRSYTLNELGRDFPRFLRETRPPRLTEGPDEIDLLIDLATVERTYSEVFDGPGSERLELLTAEQLSGLDVNDWLGCRLKVVPSLRFLALQFPVHELISARRKDSNAALPDSSPTWLVVTRREYIVRRVSVPEEEFLMLQDLAAGMTIEDALRQALWGCANPGALPSQVKAWFSAWTAAGYFSEIER